MKIIRVAAAALIDYDGRILLTSRPSGKIMSGLWEFPGGKIEDNETPEECIIRELHEELSINTYKSCLAPLTFNSHSYNGFHLIIYLYLCRKWEGSVTANEGQQTTWITANKLKDFSMPEANKHLCAMLRDYL